jgi:predicted ATP-grasp superfamily ATP-dependent carboligase
VLGLGENGYGVLRSLARAGVQVTGFYSEPREVGRFSRYVLPQFLDRSLDEETICDRLIDCARATGTRPVILPTSDRFAFLLSRHQQRLRDHFLFHWVDPDTLAAAADKALVARSCQRAGVPMPFTHITVAGEDPSTLASSLPFPCLVKPNRGFETALPGGMKNFVAHTPQALAAFFRAHPHLVGSTVCQQIIEGGDDEIFQCTVLIGSAGHATAVCVRKLHQYPPGYGVMCYGRTEDSPQLRSDSLKLLRELQYAGLASLEFKHRGQDDLYYFIEVNPRLPWYNALFTDAAVNLAYAAYVDLTNGPSGDMPRQRDGVHWIALKLDSGWYLRTRRERRAALAKWLACVVRARSHAWFDWRDLKPFLHATVQLLQLAAALLLRPQRGGGSWSTRYLRRRSSS